MEQADLDVLYPQTPPKGAPANLKVVELPLESGVRAPGSFVKSVKRFGIIEPLVVADHGDEGYEVVDGRRRLAAATELKLETVPCRVFDAADVKGYSHVLTVALNEERGPNEAANFAAVKSLAMSGFSEQKIARATGITVPRVKSYLSLTSVHPAILSALAMGTVKMSVVQQLKKLPRYAQNALVTTLLEQGKSITARDVKEYAIVPKTESGNVFQNDRIDAWTGSSVNAIVRLIEDAPSGAHPLALAFLKDALAALQGRRGVDAAA